MALRRFQRPQLQLFLLIIALGMTVRIWDDDPSTSNGDGVPWNSFTCPRCHRHAWASSGKLSCRTGHTPTPMALADLIDPNNSPDIDVFIP
ncbi:hypothetical protein Dvina_07155 [Dactylosporangium vinaceum]|uniref:Secreted protein n=1 Tax=Dactylosporangium vinaceum TaxID=53362 RepID=A0ABV5M6J7_9ACTN|nr:hypothetical protein [Dactylosporangium vinaceum]UAB97886.1 hypothetical protein Dvina_07155 [Dactylosporangium vinaceum]